MAPAGSRFKGYETLLVRELVISAELFRYRRERWLTPEGNTIIAPLPAGLLGGFGANLRRLCLVLHAQGQVTTERLTSILNGIGMEISKRQVVRILTSRLEDFVAELLMVLERPEIPLHTNASENDLRACVTKRPISGGTMSADGREARDVMLGLMKTCRKLGISFFAYLGDRPALNGPDERVPFLPELVVVRPA